MANDLRTVFFDHTRHRLWVRDVDAVLDVLAFKGEEGLSQPFKYRVEFTCAQQDLGAERLLGQEARFSLHALPLKYPKLNHDLTPVPVPPLRTLYGVITGFKRLSGSRDEARYEDWGAERRFQACYAAMLEATEAGLLVDTEREAFTLDRVRNA